MKEKEKILFIIPYLVGGGALKTVANLSKEMTKKYDVKIIGIYGSEQKFDFAGELIELNFKYTKNPIKKLIDFFKAVRIVKKYKSENNFLFSTSFLVIADIINVFSKSKNKEKTIVSIRNNESVEYKDKFFRRMQVKYATKKADHIVAISKEVENDLIENFAVPKNKVTTIYNPCVINNQPGEVKNVFNTKNTIITVGGLKRQKGQWHLIRAMREVVKSVPDAKLLILGRGNYEDYLKRIVKNNKLESHVEFIGYVLNPYDYVKKSSVFVFPSLFEGLGNAMMEMLACGIPVISTDYSCGAREILAPNTNFMKKTMDSIDYAEYGILVPVCDGNEYTSEPSTKEEQLMAEAVIKVLKDEKTKNNYINKSLARSKDFELSNITKEWYNLIERIKKEN